MEESEKQVSINRVPLNAGLERELLKCPFCGCKVYFFSNHDWHRLRGEHDDDCIFEWDADMQMVPATDEQKELVRASWNRRSNVKLRGCPIEKG